MSENTTPQGSVLTVDGAANAFLGMMEPAEEPNGQAETEEISEEAGEAVEDELVEHEEVETEKPSTFKVKAAGEEREVTLEQLIEGYQLGQDYTKKTQTLSEQRKEVEAERAKISEANKLRDQYAQRLQMMEQFLQQQTKGENLEALKETDPIGYAVKVAEQQQRKEQLAVLKAEQQRIAQQQQAEQSERLKSHIAEESSKLASSIPGYADPKQGDQIRRDIREYAKSIGWTDQELANIYDSRAVLSLYQGMKYASLQKAKPNVTKKVTEAPKTMKSGVSQSRDVDSEQRKKAMAQLKRTGNVRDAANAFERFL
ncbi:scaffolding protein [Caudoviricetes sp.]|nr:scaffolding protein [Caudoviricetes sp.]UOF78357.1 scaffolding protein [Bacteriophage sp.]